jgi:Uma2 family endonuclease
MSDDLKVGPSAAGIGVAMLLTSSSQQMDMTVEELASRVGAIPLWRIRSTPIPGTAIEDDVARVRRDESLLCELIEGVLVEKAVSNLAALIAIKLSSILDQFVSSRRLGWVLGPDGFLWVSRTKLRAPDVSFIARDQIPGGKFPREGYLALAPVLAVEIFSPGDTARELEEKRRDCFSAGTKLFWIIYPERQEAEVSTGLETHHTVGRDGALEGGQVLPGFSLKIADLFSTLDLS